MNFYFKTLIALSVLVLAGCESELSKEDRSRLDTLNESISEVNEKLDRMNNLKSVDSLVEAKPLIIAQPRFESDIDRALHELEIQNGFTHLAILPLGNGNYKVEAITRSRDVAVKEIALPASIVESARANRGYRVEIRRLINQSERTSEKKLVVEAMRSLLQGRG